MHIFSILLINIYSNSGISLIHLWIKSRDEILFLILTIFTKSNLIIKGRAYYVALPMRVVPFSLLDVIRFECIWVGGE